MSAKSKPSAVRQARRTVALGFLGPPAVLTVLVILTVRQHAFLTQVGWDPIGRTETQWPSLLALGPDGWLLSVGFAIGAVSAASLAASVALVSRSAADRSLAVLCLMLSLGMVAVTFPAVLPGAPTVWHSQIHNAGYPLIPLAVLAGAVVTSIRSSDRFPVESRCILAVIVISYPLTGLDPIAQLSRYVLFAGLMAWVVALAGSQVRRLGSPCRPL